MSRNIFALQAVRDLIKKHPERHDQGHWGAVDASMLETEGPYQVASCGSTACVAGWASTLAGAKMLIDPSEHSVRGRYFAERVLTLDGDTPLIGDHAQAVLGLASDEAKILFGAENTREEVLDMLKRLIKGKAIV